MLIFIKKNLVNAHGIYGVAISISNLGNIQIVKLKNSDLCKNIFLEYCKTTGDIMTHVYEIMKIFSNVHVYP